MNMRIKGAIDALSTMGHVCTPLRANQRMALKMLALEAMPSVRDPSVIGERDLVALYEAYLQGEVTGRAYAKTLERRYTANPLLDPLTYQPVKTPTPSDPVEPSNALDMSQYAKRSYVDQVRSDWRDSVNLQLATIKSDFKRDGEQLQRNLTDTLLKVTDALPEVVRAHTLEALKSAIPVTLTVVAPNSAPVPVGMVHRKTPSIITMLAAGVNVYLHGPAGSGKTTAGRKCAEAFGLPFYFAAKVESEYMLLGFKDARGETVRTQFREAYEHGGVFLFDEMDGSSPSAIVAMNAALANGICPFPDGVVMRHENFKCIGAGNTKLTGATREYVGRNQLDAASVDRFAFVEFGYDDALETALATNANWCLYVQDARKAVASRALKHLVTPRATYDGSKLLEAGLTWEETENAVLWKGLDTETVMQLKAAMTVKAPAPVSIL